jgi:acetolactate synthase regulatory subunit
MAEPTSQDPLPIIFDACCLFTLFGTQRAEEVLRALRTDNYVCKYVVDHEPIQIYSGPDGDERSERRVVSLDPLIDADVLEIVTLRAEEASTFIRIAREMDDGDARTLAIAAHRGFHVATDNRKARNDAKDRTPELPVITTPEILQMWEQQTGASPDDVRSVLQSVERRSRYRPPSDDPGYDGWRRHEETRPDG